MRKLFFLAAAASLFFMSANAKDKFQPFTGKITGNKVRMRTSPDLESHILKELNKNELLLITQDENEFWAVKPPVGTKAYVYRSYILDNIVEANRVNIRLTPDVDAPIIGQLKKGDHISGIICPTNHKWIQVTPPENVKFYISKDYVTYAGDEKYIAQINQKRIEAENLINSAYFIVQQETKKPFEKMEPQEAINQFDKVIKDYAEFSDYVVQAKEGLALLQDQYLQKKIAFLESKANLMESEKKQLLAKLAPFHMPKDVNLDTKEVSKIINAKNLWEKHEADLYQSWASFHPDKDIKDFYKEQKVNSIRLMGKIVSYDDNISNKPGNYLIQMNNKQMAYLYSTQVDLSKHINKNIEILVSPRPNNNFAYPAYFVTEIR